jgi:serine protease Do
MRALIFTLVFFPLSAFSDPNPFSAGAAIYKVYWQSGNVRHYGTGVQVAPDKILTNCHVVNGAASVMAYHEKSGKTYAARAYYNLGNYDACIVVGNFSNVTPVPFASDFEIGQTVWHYGYPKELYGYGMGPILRVVNTNQGPTIESGSYCNHGSSGGPLLDVHGELVGLNFGVFTAGNHDLCLSIPASALKPLIRY